MKVLLLPVNIASDISHKVRALRAIGVDARGFSIAESTIQSGDGVEFISIDHRPGKLAKLNRIRAYGRMWRMIARADVLHWVADANIFGSGPHFGFLRRLNKPGVVQWVGSDIRVPEIDLEINPFYRRAYAEGYEYKGESADVSRQNQRFAFDLGFYPLEFIGMGHYIDRSLFPKTFRTWQSIVLSEHEPRFPDPGVRRPIVLHSPSAPVAKGTRHIVAAIDRLRSRHDFDFQLLADVPRREALRRMSECDIYVDQLIIGAHGYAAVEAMAFGKPVVCHIDPVIGREYPPDLPIIDASPDTIHDTLEMLLSDGAALRQYGSKSRAYAAKYHDDKTIAAEMVGIYEEVIRLHRGRE